MPTEGFRILGGERFLEIAPAEAHKGNTVTYLLQQYPSPETSLLYIGDDDKDEEAFNVIHAHNGVAIKVGATPSQTANLSLNSPHSVTIWLENLLKQLPPNG